MDRHQAMEYFCRVVESGSFAATARDMGCSRSVVSKHIAWLEQWTNSSLLARTTRRLRVTEAGQRFYEYCQRVAAETEQMFGSIGLRRDEVAGRLVVAAPVSLTLAALSAHLFAFQRAYPGILLDVRLSDTNSDLIRDGVDVALRARAELQDSSLVATPLATIERVVCATPAYWERHGMPQTPRELRSHDCLTYLLASDAQTWEFRDGGQPVRVPVRGQFCADNSLLLIQAALEGKGVALVPTLMVLPHLRDGVLAAALQAFTAEPRSLYAVYPRRAHLPRKVRVFVQFLRDRLVLPEQSGLSVAPHS